jgi:hypothetical protein
MHFEIMKEILFSDQLRLDRLNQYASALLGQKEGVVISCRMPEVEGIEELSEERIQDSFVHALAKTDYIASKLAEAVSKYISTGDNTDVLLLREKYALELINREQWRKEIDKLQQELKLLDK